DKERDGQSSPQPSPRTFSQEVVQRGDYYKRNSDHDNDKPSSRGKRSSKLYSTIAEEEVNAIGHRKSQPTNVSRRSWGQQSQEYQEQKQQSPSKDGRQGSKSSDSGEEAEKEFIFV
uniref:Capping protein regulator and myosin 1 linker 1 n=3 Tax=Elephantidae TaxID=9780 RepID=G3U6F5_LOXAF